MTKKPPASARASVSELARISGLHRNTIGTKLQLPDAPRPDSAGNYEVVSTLRWVKDHSAFSPDFRKLQKRKWELVIARMEREESQARGELIAVAEVEQVLGPLIVDLAQQLRSKFEAELPSRYVSKNQHECRKLNEDAIDAIFARFKSSTKGLVSAVSGKSS